MLRIEANPNLKAAISALDRIQVKFPDDEEVKDIVASVQGELSRPYGKPKLTYLGIKPIEFAEALAVWHTRHESRGMKAIDVIDIFLRKPSISAVIAIDGTQSSPLSAANRLSRLLRDRQGRLSGGYTVIPAPARGGSRNWKVVKGQVEIE